MKYKLADKNQISELVDIRIKYLKEDIGHITEEEQRKMEELLPPYFERHLGLDFFPFIAQEGERIIASAFLLITEKPASPHFINGRTGMVLNVYTDKDYRRQGIAFRLMQMLTEHARQNGLDYIELKATQDGYPLYQKCGFSESTEKYISMKYFLR